MTDVVPDLRSMTLEQLAELLGSADDALRDAVIAETDRRDRNDRRRQARRADPIAREWFEAAHTQFVAAESACNGYLVNRRGRAADIDPWSLWSGPASRAEAYASYELTEFWESNPRLTIGEYRRQVAAARAAYEDDQERAASEVPDARDLAERVRESGPGVLDSYSAEMLGELLDAERAAEWLGIAKRTVYVDRSRGRWPEPDMTAGRSGAWTRRTLVLHLAERAGRGAPGRARRPRKAMN